MSNGKKIAICINSSALDQVYSGLIMAATAVTMAEQVDLCVAMGGIGAFVKGKMDTLDVAAELQSMGEDFKKRVIATNYIKPYDLVKAAKESGNCRIHVCQPAIDLFGYTREDLIPEVDDVLGAAAALDISLNADLVLVY
jgi:peroxiredoxin family protein